MSDEMDYDADPAAAPQTLTKEPHQYLINRWSSTWDAGKTHLETKASFHMPGAPKAMYGLAKEEVLKLVQVRKTFRTTHKGTWVSIAALMNISSAKLSSEKRPVEVCAAIYNQIVEEHVGKPNQRVFTEEEWDSPLDPNVLDELNKVFKFLEEHEGKKGKELSDTILEWGGMRYFPDSAIHKQVLAYLTQISTT